MNGQSLSLHLPTSRMRLSNIKWYVHHQDVLYSMIELFFQATGKSIDCFVSDCIEKGISNKLGDEIVKRVSSSMYAGGADTVR